MLKWDFCLFWMFEWSALWWIDLICFRLPAGSFRLQLICEISNLLSLEWERLRRLDLRLRLLVTLLPDDEDDDEEDEDERRRCFFFFLLRLSSSLSECRPILAVQTALKFLMTRQRDWGLIVAPNIWKNALLHVHDNWRHYNIRTIQSF